MSVARAAANAMNGRLRTLTSAGKLQYLSDLKGDWDVWHHYRALGHGIQHYIAEALVDLLPEGTEDGRFDLRIRATDNPDPETDFLLACP